MTHVAAQNLALIGLVALVAYIWLAETLDRHR